MGTIIKVFTYYYFLLYPHFAFPFPPDHVTIVNEDTIDKEYDSTVYQKNLFQPTTYLNAGYGVLYEHIGTVYQSVHTYFISMDCSITIKLQQSIGQ